MRQRVINPKTQDARRETAILEPMAEGAIPMRKNRQREWGSFSDGELVRFAMSFMKENRIVFRCEFENIDLGFFAALRRRGLLDNIGLKSKRRKWSLMRDEQLIQHAKSFIKQKGVTHRKGLFEADSGLYQVLKARDLLGKIGLRYDGWKYMEDESIISIAQAMIDEKGIKHKKAMERTYGKIYSVLKRRKLLNKIGFAVKRIQRDWTNMQDDQIVKYAINRIRENGISGRSELLKADPGLYKILYKRNLLDRLGFEKKRIVYRDWESLTDTQLCQQVNSFMKKNGIVLKSRLKVMDPGLYVCLVRRNLLSVIFDPIYQSNDHRAVQDVIDALRDFGEGK